MLQENIYLFFLTLYSDFLLQFVNITLFLFLFLSPHAHMHFFFLFLSFFISFFLYLHACTLLGSFLIECVFRPHFHNIRVVCKQLSL